MRNRSEYQYHLFQNATELIPQRRREASPSCVRSLPPFANTSASTENPLTSLLTSSASPSTKQPQEHSDPQQQQQEEQEQQDEQHAHKRPPKADRTHAGASRAHGSSKDKGNVRKLRVHGVLQRVKFPLDPSLLPTLDLRRAKISAQHIQSLKDHLEASLDQAMIDASTVNKTREGISWRANPVLDLPVGAQKDWKCHYDKHNFSFYNKRKHLGKWTSQMLAKAQIQTTLDEVVYGTHCDTTADFRVYLAQVFQENFLDGSVVHTFETRQEDDMFHYFGIKWLAFRFGFQDHLLHDAMVVELSKTIVLPTGEKILARIYESIDWKCHEMPFGFCRDEMAIVILHRLDQNLQVEFCMHAKVKIPIKPTGDLQHPNQDQDQDQDQYQDQQQYTEHQHSFPTASPDGLQPPQRTMDNKKTSNWLVRHVVNSLLQSIANVVGCADAKYIFKRQLMMQSSSKWKPNHLQRTCKVCLKSFHLLRQRHHCRLCGEIMCSDCTMMLFLLTSYCQQGSKTKPNKFCLTCIDHFRQKRGIFVDQQRQRFAVLAQCAHDDLRSLLTNGNESEGYMVARSFRSIKFDPVAKLYKPEDRGGVDEEEDEEQEEQEEAESESQTEEEDEEDQKQWTLFSSRMRFKRMSSRHPPSLASPASNDEDDFHDLHLPSDECLGLVVAEEVAVGEAIDDAVEALEVDDLNEDQSLQGSLYGSPKQLQSRHQNSLSNLHDFRTRMEQTRSSIADSKVLLSQIHSQMKATTTTTNNNNKLLSRSFVATSSKQVSQYQEDLESLRSLQQSLHLQQIMIQSIYEGEDHRGMVL